MLKCAGVAATIAVLASSAWAGTVPSEIRARYTELKKTMEKRDTKKFATFFAPEFTNVDKKGKVATRAQFLSMVEGLFKDALRIEPNEKLISSTKKGEIVIVKFEFEAVITSRAVTQKLFQAGTDHWKKVKGRWVMVKTVETDTWLKPLTKRSLVTGATDK